MGNSQSETSSKFDYKKFTYNYTFQKKFNDSRFGEVKLFKNELTGETILQRDYITNTEKDCDRYAQQIQLRSILQHPNIVRIIGYTKKQEHAYCTSYYKVSAFLEAFEHDLEEALYAKIQRKVTPTTQQPVYHY